MTGGQNLAKSTVFFWRLRCRSLVRKTISILSRCLCTGVRGSFSREYSYWPSETYYYWFANWISLLFVSFCLFIISPCFFVFRIFIFYLSFNVFYFSVIIFGWSFLFIFSYFYISNIVLVFQHFFSVYYLWLMLHVRNFFLYLRFGLNTLKRIKYFWFSLFSFLSLSFLFFFLFSSCVFYNKAFAVR